MEGAMNAELFESEDGKLSEFAGSVAVRRRG